MSDIYIYGAGGHAVVVAACARLSGYRVAGFIEDASSRYGQLYDGAVIMNVEQIPPASRVIVGLGHCSRRKILGEELADRGFQLTSLIHPSAQISENVQIGKGCYIGALVCIDPHCIIEDSCIVNNHCVVCHGSFIGKGSHLCPSVTLAGNVRIGTQCWIGLASCIIERITIGEKTMLGAGAVVVNDLPAHSFAYGVPAKVRKLISDF